MNKWIIGTFFLIFLFVKQGFTNNRENTAVICHLEDSLAVSPEPDTTKAKTAHKITFKDSLDGAFDLSDFLINAHGFIPVPSLITEPALGGIGGFAGLVFIQPPKERVIINKQGSASPVRPTIALLGGMYTANGSWALAGGYTSEWLKYGIIYTIGGAYADVNMNLYRTLPFSDNEIHASFNFNSVPLLLSVRKTFLRKFSAGLKYMYAYTDVSVNSSDTMAGHYYFNELLSKFKMTNRVSKLSPVVVFDTRDNMFSPNNGLRIDAEMDWSAKAIGSDFDFTQLDFGIYGYKQFVKPWVAALRLEWSQIFNDPAFYMLPSISLRGVPAERYQGNITALAETEQRVTVYKRWSVVGFAGLGKAFDTYDTFDKSKWVYNYGGGFRYLLARKFNLQMGADLGFGPDDWGIYIIFGSSWLRD